LRLIATQRGQSSTAMAGSVAAALRMKAREAALADVENSTSREGTRGVGWRPVHDLLKSAGYKTSDIQEQLAILKSSGDYTRIMGEVAAALRMKAKEAALASTGEVTSSRHGGSKVGDKSIGRPAILDILRNVPGITENSVNELVVPVCWRLVGGRRRDAKTYPPPGPGRGRIAL